MGQDRGSNIEIAVKRGGEGRERINLYDFLIDGMLDLVSSKTAT